MSNIGHNKPPLDPKETIQNNINRKKPILDRDPQFFKDLPIPSWIELSLIDVCNRSCSFCPKSNDEIAPNTHNKMERSLIDKLYKDLKKINFKGACSICGYGEPLLYKDIDYMIEVLGELGPIEIVTNGDPLNVKKLSKLFKSKVTQLVISLYDGPEQILKFNDMMKQAGVPENFVTLRDRWYKEDKDYGVKLTNRVGTIDSGNQPTKENYKDRTCFYTSYQIMIDWDGNTYLCPQDWQRRVSLGNIMQKEFFEIWNGNLLNKYRKKLLNGERSLNPCNKCNADGQIYGKKHYLAYLEKYKRNK